MKAGVETARPPTCGVAGGPHRKRYPIESKLKAVGYAQSVVEGGGGPGDTVGLTSATRALGILDKATLASWVKNRPTYEKEVQAAATAYGTRTSDALAHRLLTHPLVIMLPCYHTPGILAGVCSHSLHSNR